MDISLPRLNSPSMAVVATSAIETVTNIREVWNFNIREEFEVIRKILPLTSFASFDTEFPGTVFRPDVPKHCLSSLPPHVNYSYMKANVDSLNLIQFGLTLSTEPNHCSNGVSTSFVWQFNIKDFDIDKDSHNPESIALLKKQGIDFARNKVDGIDSALLGYMLVQSGVLNHRAWVTFHGAYDFCFIVKILTRRPLPSDLNIFLGLVKQIFWGSIFDVKHIMKSCKGLYGGLDKLAKILQVERKGGTKSHQAGSDSLLTMEVFFKLRSIYFDSLYFNQITEFKNILHGLEVPIMVHKYGYGFSVPPIFSSTIN